MLFLQLLHERSDVSEATANTVNRPSGDNIQLPVRSILRELVERGALFPALGARYAVIDVRLDDLPAAVLCDALKVSALVFDGLAAGGDSQVESNAKCFRHLRNKANTPRN